MARTITPDELRRLIESEIKEMQVNERVGGGQNYRGSPRSDELDESEEADQFGGGEVEGDAITDIEVGEEASLSEDIVLERWRRLAGLLKS